MTDKESVIVKKRDLADIIQNPDKNAIEEFLEDPGAVLAASLTDLFTSPRAYLERAVRVVQAAFKSDVFYQLGREVKLLREKGTLPEDLSGNKFGYQTWVELLSIIDEDTPDTERLEALKAMFLACNKMNSTDAEHILGYQLFQIAKRLDSNELLVLKAVFELHRKGKISDALNHGNQYQLWAQTVSGHLGHSLEALVELADDMLVKSQLLTKRSPDGSGFNPRNARLTDLGLKFCENIERYQIEKKGLEK